MHAGRASWSFIAAMIGECRPSCATSRRDSDATTSRARLADHVVATHALGARPLAARATALRGLAARDAASLDAHVGAQKRLRPRVDRAPRQSPAARAIRQEVRPALRRIVEGVAARRLRTLWTKATTAIIARAGEPSRAPREGRLVVTRFALARQRHAHHLAVFGRAAQPLITGVRDGFKGAAAAALRRATRHASRRIVEVVAHAIATAITARGIERMRAQLSTGGGLDADADDGAGRASKPPGLASTPPTREARHGRADKHRKHHASARPTPHQHHGARVPQSLCRQP